MANQCVQMTESGFLEVILNGQEEKLASLLDISGAARFFGIYSIAKASGQKKTAFPHGSLELEGCCMRGYRTTVDG